MANLYFSSPEDLALCLLEDPIRPDPQHTIAALKHRLTLVQIWQIRPGSSVLEIGGGRGDFTVVLADAVGPNGHVVAIDPAAMDYGTPTQAQAHAHILHSRLGSRIEFRQEDPTQYMSQMTRRFDHIVFCHCIWYFADSSLLSPMVSLALQHSTSLLIAEYALATPFPAAVPHVLAALAWNTYEACRPDRSESNIRTALSPKQVRSLVESTGWTLAREEIISPGPGQRDGYREVQMVRMKMFEDAVDSLGSNSKIKDMLLGLRDAVDTSVGTLVNNVKEVRNMDVWVATFNDLS